MKILFPCDATHPVATIIDQVATVLPLADCSVHLLYVKRPTYEHLLRSSGQYIEDSCRDLEEHVKKTLDTAEQILSGICLKVTREIACGSPALTIERVACNQGFDLTILAPGWHPLVERVLLGSVSSKVVKRGKGKYLIVHPLQKYPVELRKVLIGLDGSAAAREAMVKSVDMFHLNRRNVNVVLLYVVDEAHPLKLITSEEFVSCMEETLIMEGERYLSEAKQMLADAGVKKVDYALKQGKPTQELIKAARALPADLIITGSDTQTLLEQLLQESVSHCVAMNSPCAVAVVKKAGKPVRGRSIFPALRTGSSTAV
jgi:nucleotide-binding universal stress UspA family protein